MARRIGAVAPEKITNAIRKVHDFLTVGAPAPLQEAGVWREPARRVLQESCQDTASAATVLSRRLVWLASNASALAELTT